LFGCLREFRRDQLSFLREMQRIHGDYVRVPTLPGYSIYLVADPAAVEHILVRNYKNYPKAEFIVRPVRMVLGNGLFSSEGDFWLRQRRLSQPAFVRSAILRLAPSMTKAVEGLIHKWEAGPDGQVLDLVSEMMRLILEIAGTTLFGADVAASNDAINAAERDTFAMVRHILDNPLAAPLWVPTRLNRKYKRAKRFLDDVVIRVIESRRRQGPAANDLLDMLLAARDEETGAGMSDAQLRDEVLTLLFAGHDTTGAALAWVWYLLARHPQVQEQVHDEAAAHLAGRTPAAEDLPYLPLATAVFEEALRLYPPAPGLGRCAAEPDEIQGRPIPRKAIVIPSQWLVHRHPDYWDEPDQFRPERFLPDHAATRPKFAYFPFGGGPRACIGNTFAMVEGALIIAGLSQRFRFRAVDENEAAIDMTFVLKPKGAVNLTVEKRF
jgi:cytochrome P450